LLAYVNGNYSQRIFRPAVRNAGLPPETTTHDLRHAFASDLVAAGVSVAVVADLLGHSNAKLVVSTYLHPPSDYRDQARQAIELSWNSDKCRTKAGGRTANNRLTS
jgi:integrase